MNSERIKQIQEETAYPNSVSVQQALLKVWNECEQQPTLLTEDKEGEGQEVTDDEIAQEARKRYPYSDDDTEARMNKLSSKRRRFIEGAKWMQFEIIQKQNFKQ